MRVDIDEPDREAPTGQSEQDLLVDGAIGAMQEPVSGRVRQQDREVVVPVRDGCTERPIRVIPEEATLLPQVGRQQTTGASRDPLTDREEDGPWQPDAEVVAGPATRERDDLSGGRELVGRGREVERQSLRGRIEQQPDDRVRHVVDRHDVDAETAPRGDDPQLPRQEQPHRRVERVEGLDVAGPRVADDHGGADDRDGELGGSRAGRSLAFELGLLVGAAETERVGEVVLPHGASPTARHVCRGHVQEPGEAVDRPSEGQDVGHAVHVGPAEVLDGGIEPQVGRRVNDVRHAPGQVSVRGVVERQAWLPDVAGHRVDARTERGAELGSVPPRTGRGVDRLGIGPRGHERDDLEAIAGEQPCGHLRPEEPGPPREQDYVAHAGTPHPCATANACSSSRFLQAAAACAS